MTFLANLIGVTLAIGMQATSASFSEYSVDLYRGDMHISRDISRDHQGVWRDGAGKAIAKPEVNFAGRYYLGVHSCGASCRFYSLTDLSTGADLDALNMFASTDPPPTTRDGYRYVSYLTTKPDSVLLIATYVIDTPSGTKCRERPFALQELTLVPVARTKAVPCR